MASAPSGGPRAGAHTKAGTKSGGISAIPTPANNISGGGSGGVESSQGGGDNACMPHGSARAGAGGFSSLENLKKPGEDEYGTGPKETHEFAQHKPGSKSLLGQWMENFRG
ncbi:hypothetical protein VTO42DRAFT_8651 [Malbranchea cinnamomea]